MIARENYITVQAWMSQDLNLTGNELLLYALIYGFCQDGLNVFKCSMSYVSDWLQLSRRQIIKLFQKLLEKNLIIKLTENNDKTNEYQINFIYINQLKNLTNEKQLLLNEIKKEEKNLILQDGVKKVHGGSEKSSLGGVKKVHGGSEKSSHNNNIYNNIDNNIYNKEKYIKRKNEIDSLDFIENEEEKKIFLKWLDYKKERKQTYKSKTSIKTCYERLLKLSNGNILEMEKIINQSIANNYSGLFELKKNSYNRNTDFIPY